MSPQPAYPRAAASHEVTAAGVLERHARSTGWTRSLPVPIESIARDTYGIRVTWDDVAETSNECVLAVVHPKAAIIALNQRHRDILAEVVGPLRFVVAHELGHLLYDADRGSALFDHPAFCRRLAADDPRVVREANADRLAAALLLPADLVRAELGRSRPSRPRTLEEMGAMAGKWGVSCRTLVARLDDLGLGWCFPGLKRPPHLDVTGSR